mmetsp:Transcript_66162/g.159667  ORF Transcript_66162/g.159667 Transcript_66162/m.159667 type:complete len:253 (+) Transcript_66162:110-868(+)
MSGGSVQVVQHLDDLRVLLVLGPVQRRLAIRVLEAGVGLRIEQRRDAGRVAFLSREVQRRVLALGALGVQAGALGDEVVDAVDLAFGSRPHEGRQAVAVCSASVYALVGELLEEVEVALASRIHQADVDDLRCEVGGGVLQELDDLRVILGLGVVQRRLAILVLEARVGPRLEQELDAGSVAAESRAVQRRALPLVCGMHVHPLVHEAGEGGEVALARRIEKVLLRLRAQPEPPAVSASIAGARGRGAVWGG